MISVEFRGLARKALRNPTLVLSLLALLTVMMAYSLTMLEDNASIVLLGDEHPSRIAEKYIKSHYSNSGEQIIVSISNKNSDALLDASSIKTIDDLSTQFLKLSIIEKADHKTLDRYGSEPELKKMVDDILSDGLNQKDVYKLATLRGQLETKGLDIVPIQSLITKLRPVQKVRSLTTIENISSVDDELFVEKLYKSSDKRSSKEFVHAALKDEIYVDSLISRDGKQGNIYIELDVDEDDAPKLLAIYKQVLAEIARFDNRATIRLSGSPIITAEIDRQLKVDQALTPLVILVIAFCLFFFFRRVKATLLILGVAIVSIIWTMGTMSLLDIEMRAITSMLPVMLISISVADGIHLLMALDRAEIERNKHEAISRCFYRIGKPLLLTSLTTSAGFLALSQTSILPVKEFGYLAALGVIYAYLVTILLVPTIILRSSKPQDYVIDSNIVNFIVCYIDKLLQNVSRSRAITITVFILLISLFSIALQNLRVDQLTVSAFGDHSVVKKDFDQIAEKFGGVLPMNVRIGAETTAYFTQPEVARKLQEVVKDIESSGNVGDVISVVDILSKINEEIGQDRIYHVPKTTVKELFSQYLLLYELGNGRELRNVINEDYSEVRLVVIADTDRGTHWQEIVSNVNASINKRFKGANLLVTFSGVGEMSISNGMETSRGLMTSIVFALIAISSVLLILFRSFRYSLIALIPLVSTLIVIYGLVSLVNKEIDVVTSLVAGIVFGIGIDYSIHLLTLLQRADLTSSQIRIRLNRVCSAILVNSLTLTLGFGVLVLSENSLLMFFGICISISMFLSALIAIIIIPLMITPSGALNCTAENSTAEVN